MSIKSDYRDESHIKLIAPTAFAVGNCFRTRKHTSLSLSLTPGARAEYRGKTRKLLLKRAGPRNGDEKGTVEKSFLFYYEHGRQTDKR